MILVKRLPVLTAVLLAACMNSAEAAEGTVEFFNASGGYGYVTDNETDETYIFESNDISGPVQEGDAVTFEVTTDDDRFTVKAHSVMIVDDDSPADAAEPVTQEQADAAAADEAAVDASVEAEEDAVEEPVSDDGADPAADEGA